jgi:hypothetical protein
MLDPLATAAAVVALLWTIYQQYQISKMCAACPLRVEATKPRGVPDDGQR